MILVSKVLYMLFIDFLKMKPIIIVIILTIVIIAGTTTLGVRHAGNTTPDQQVLQTNSVLTPSEQSESNLDIIEQTSSGGELADDLVVPVTTLNISSTVPQEKTTQEVTPVATKELLSAHDTKDDCWVGFQGKAYDITSYLTRHPGGVNKILPHCGTAQEFEDAFTRQHGTSKVSLFMKIAAYTGDLNQEGVIV